MKWFGIGKSGKKNSNEGKNLAEKYIFFEGYAFLI